MTNPILVTGGTGTLGRVVVQRLLDAGREVRVLSRRARAGEAVTMRSASAVLGRLDGDAIDQIRDVSKAPAA